ncbi:hypothetical protein EJB05_52653 [Eragrostis curvula]|uniref:Uncharacterized protein n=1 Tax=Eragrostis curvula TaxID=38414 RepID=A0A5J9SSL3_9POAL|nr:hypothetical protein EJB05_52653 [Eragrostis curvula]
MFSVLQLLGRRFHQRVRKIQKTKRKRRRSREVKKPFKEVPEPSPGFGNLSLSKHSENSSIELMEQVASELSESLVSIASFVGDELIYECTGVFIEDSCADATSILTAAHTVGTPDIALTDDLTITVRLPNGRAVTGWLHNSDLEYDLAIVNIKRDDNFQKVDLSSRHHMQFESNYNVVAVGRYFNSGMLKSSNGIVISSPTNEGFLLMDSTCKVDQAWIGGPLVDLEGNFVGMNCRRRGAKTAFLPKNKILERLGPLRDDAVHSVDDAVFARWPDSLCFPFDLCPALEKPDINLLSKFDIVEAHWR